MLNYLASKFSCMKKINKKILGIGLIVLFFSVSLIFLVKAQIVDENFFRVNSASTTPPGVKRSGDEALVHIVNRSSKDYFIPNKSIAEFEAFKNNAPRYVSISVCGDDVCGDGENEDNCPEDCFSPKPSYCGDGRCNEKWTKSITTQTITVEAKSRLCRGFWGWVSKLSRDMYFLINNNVVSDPCSPTEEIIETVTWTREGSESWETCPDDCTPSIHSGCGRQTRELLAQLENTVIQMAWQALRKRPVQLADFAPRLII